MLDGPIIDVAIGLIFFYTLLSLVCSSIQELVAGLFGLRSKNLEKGLESLLGECAAKELYLHPLVRNLSKEGKLPSYLRSATVAAALIDVVRSAGGDDSVEGADSPRSASDELAHAVERMDRDSRLRRVLLAFYREGEDTTDALEKRLASWLDEGMGRVSGWYKRRVQYIVLVIATGVTVGVNADSIRMAELLWHDDALRATAVETAMKHDSADGRALEETLRALGTSPLGYSDSFCLWTDFKLRMALGWLLTIAAISLGAPFWFDLLSKVARLRSSGTRDAEDER